MKNLSKTTKTILFAGIITAMILPFSVMSMAEAAPNENANERTPQEMVLENTVTHSEGERLGLEWLVLSVQHENMKDALKGFTVDSNNHKKLGQEISQIAKQMNDKQTAVEKIEEDARSKITISDELRLELEESEDILNESGLPLAIVIADVEKEKLIVAILNSAKEQNVEDQVLELIGNDIPVTFAYSDGVVFTVQN